jgi:hypothetical protein
LWLERHYNKGTTNEANDDTKRRQNLSNFRKKTKQKQRAIHGEMAKLWLERHFNNNTGAEKPERKQGRKIS